VLLLILGMFEGFTGYLLPFDQTAYWATVVGMNITANGPFVGTIMAQILQGGPDIGSTTLSRFYSLHMLVAPGLIFALIGLHLYLVVRLGVSSPPWSKEAAGSEHAGQEPEPPARSGLVAPTTRGRPTP
jgi:menaquinol-cytochrome c reductase cytochrome b subunit